MTANDHPLCRLCDYRPEKRVTNYRQPSWCYMFRDGEHVMPDGQGWCAQFSQDKERIKQLTQEQLDKDKP